MFGISQALAMGSIPMGNEGPIVLPASSWSWADSMGSLLHTLPRVVSGKLALVLLVLAIVVAVMHLDRSQRFVKRTLFVLLLLAAFVSLQARASYDSYPLACRTMDAGRHPLAAQFVSLIETGPLKDYMFFNAKWPFESSNERGSINITIPPYMGDHFRFAARSDGGLVGETTVRLPQDHACEVILDELLAPKK